MSVLPKVYVIDDDQPFVESLSALIKSMGLESQVFGSADQFVQVFDPMHPGCVVLELRIPGMSGLELQERLSREPISPPLVFVTAHADLEMALQAKRMGAVDFLQKQSLSENELWEAIHAALARDQANRQVFNRRQMIQNSLDQLSGPERNVLDLLLIGNSNQRIADALGVSRRAVESRRARLMKKLGVSTLPDLVRFGIEAGLYGDASETAGD